MGIRVPANHVELIFRMKMLNDNEEMLCTIGAGEEAATGFGQAQADNCKTTWGQFIMPLLANNTTFVGLTARTGPDGSAIVFESPASVVGSYAGSALPPNCSLLVRKRSNQGGRRNRGRMYIPGCPEGVVEPNGDLTAAYLTSFQQQINAWRTALADVSGISELAIFHTTGLGLPGLPPTMITSLIADKKIATQRRRLR